MTNSAAGGPVLGYCDQLTYRQGDVVAVRASGRGPVDVSLVRLNHPPDDPDWPVPVTSPVGTVPVTAAVTEPQPTVTGSYLFIEDAGPLAAARALSTSLYVLPTRLRSGHPQVLISTISPAGDGGFALVIDEEGALTLCWGRASGPAGRLASPAGLLEGYWHLVSAALDEAGGRVTLAHAPVAAVPGGAARWTGSARDTGIRLASGPAVLIGAGALPGCLPASRLPGRPGVATGFNGKLEQPVLTGAAVPPGQVPALSPASAAAGAAVIGAWDFSRDQGTAAVADVSGKDRKSVV